MQQHLSQKDCAFANGEEGLVTSSGRSTIAFDNRTSLNVEWFSSHNAEWPVLAFVPGVCESAETWTVQNLAVACQQNKFRLVVLELEGHGLSSGQPAVCGNFDRLVEQVVAFYHHILAQQTSKIVLSGCSLGGVLAAYAAAKVSTSVAMICPAVGVAKEAIPHWTLVSALSVMSLLAPSAGIMTPVEDPSHYACPASSTRNFSGHWPLSTSKMLLDTTSGKVASDQASGQLSMANVPSVFVMAGEKDYIVPEVCIKQFFENIQLPDKQKTYCTIPNGDHGLFVGKKTAKVAIEQLFTWLNSS